MQYYSQNCYKVIIILSLILQSGKYVAENAASLLFNSLGNNSKREMTTYCVAKCCMLTAFD